MKSRTIKMIYQGETYRIASGDLDSLSLQDLVDKWLAALSSLDSLSALLDNGSYIVIGKEVIQSAVFMLSEHDFGEE